jgi:hypothetical protein
MSRRLLVFLGNRLAKVGSGDVELLGLLVDVCCALSVDCAPVVLTGVLCIVICVAVPGVKGLRIDMCTVFEPFHLPCHHAPLYQ